MAITTTHLDSAQTIRNSYDDASQSFRVNVVDATSSGLSVISSYQISNASINGSGGAVYQVTASTSANIAKLVPNEQTGVPINVYTGAAGFETLLVILAPGQDNVVDVNIPAGTRLSVRANQVAAPNSGSTFLTFIG